MVLTTQDMHYLCHQFLSISYWINNDLETLEAPFIFIILLHLYCQRIARLEVSLLKEIAGSKRWRYLATSPYQEFTFVGWSYQLPTFSPEKTSSNIANRSAENRVCQLRTTVKIHFVLCIASFYTFYDWNERKKLFKCQKIDFDQQTACGAPVWWSKYKTHNIS